MTKIVADTIIDGRYRVIERVGSGGMADVFCVEDMQLGRRVALKLLHERFAADAEFVERFRREASSAAGLQHSNIVSVYDRGEWDGTYYIAMEFLEGRSLKDIIQNEGPIPAERAIALTLQILRAAQFAHKRGIVHRDIKPHNVIVDAEDHLKVTDFGIARAGASDVTETGSIIGTARYLSPEQAQGAQVNGQSDLYSIGIVLYELLTGRVPFEADSAVSVALKHISEQPPSPRVFNPTVSPELEDIVLCALAKQPEGRFATADDFIAALEHAHDPTVAAPPPVFPSQVDAPTMAMSSLRPGPPGPGAVEPPFEENGNRKWWIIGTLGVLLVAGLLVGAYFLFLTPTKVTVPDVVGKQAQAAIQELRSKNLEANVNLVSSSKVESGIVSTQNPAANERVKEGTVVTMEVSSGPGLATIPDVEGLSQRAAEDKLRKAGFRVETQAQESDTVPSGKAIGTNPSSPLQLEKGQTVTLYISSGPKNVTVPDVSGLSQSEAKASLSGVGLNTKTVEKESSSAAGTVISQNPAAEQMVKKGSTVTITIAKGPAQIQVPDVTTKSVDTAVNTLSNAGFTVHTATTNVTNADQDGVVISQDPAGGTAADKGSQVTITVGKFTSSSGGGT